MKKLDKAYWENKYITETLGWDIGYPSTPLKEYIDQLSNKDFKILIPGAGKGYEVVYLFEQGFQNVYVIDIATQPLAHIKKQLPLFPEEQLIEGDFFDLTISDFDLILEQTFFCALPPALRAAYVTKMATLLKPGGKLAGLLFDFPLTEAGPPFGGSLAAYEALFKEHFNLTVLERAHNSIKPRAGKELFFIFERKPLG